MNNYVIPMLLLYMIFLPECSQNELQVKPNCNLLDMSGEDTYRAGLSAHADQRQKR